MAKYTKWIEATPDEAVPGVAERALRSRFEPIQDYLPLAAHQADENIEYVHQSRVWSRRAAAALRVYHELLPKQRTRWLKRKLRRIRQASNDARDADVFLARLATEGPNPGVAQLLEEVRRFRQTAQAAIVEVDEWLMGDGRLVRRCEQLLCRVRWRGAEKRRSEPPRFGAWAPRQLGPVADDFFAAAAADLSDVRALHQFRIAGKKLRYALELLGAAVAPELHTVTYPVIQELQTRLGVINDHATARKRLTGWLEQTQETAASDYLRSGLEAERRHLEQLHGEFRAWWAPARRNDLRQQFEPLLGKNS